MHSLGIVEVVFKPERVLLPEPIHSAGELHKSLEEKNLSRRPCLQYQKRVSLVSNAQQCEAMPFVPDTTEDLICGPAVTHVILHFSVHILI